MPDVSEDASELNDPDVKHISAAEYKAMTVNLSRMLPFCTGLDFSLRESYRKIGQRLARDFNTVSKAAAVSAAPHSGVPRYAAENITPIFQSQEVGLLSGGY